MAYIPAEHASHGTAEDIAPLTLLVDVEHGCTLLALPANLAFLEGEWRGEVTEARYVGHFRGGAVSNLAVEVDHLSVFDAAASRGVPALALIRKNDKLYLHGLERGRSGFGDRKASVPLIEDLAQIPAHSSVGYYRWRLVLPVGNERIVIHSVDVTPSA